MVNVLDVSYNAPGGDMLDNIFNHQRSLMDKYHSIEHDNGLLQCSQVPVILDDKFGQARLKDFAWRITEELGEALEACYIKRHHHTHTWEELIDGLHFLTEFSILAGVGAAEVAGGWRGDKLCYLWKHCPDAYPGGGLATDEAGFMALVGQVIMYLGMTCNCLKNKPWKQTHQVTDQLAFLGCLYQVWNAYFFLLRGLGMRPDDIYDLYMRKNAVNQFRQRSQY